MNVTRYITVDGFPVLDPFEQYESAERLNTPLDFWMRANSYSNPRGQTPGVAWVLVSREVHKNITSTSAREGYHTLRFHDGGTVTAVTSLTIVSATCMSIDGDSLAPFLIELHDIRERLKLYCCASQYNVRCPAPLYFEEDGIATGLEYTYHDETLTAGGDFHTWQEILDSLWDQMGAAGTVPTLPFEPEGIPENWRFIGISIWDAIGELLQAIGCETVYDPIAHEISVVRLGEPTYTDTQLTPYRARLIYDYKPTELVGWSMPETVRVFFPKVQDHHGTEKETPREFNFETDNWYSLDVASGITGALAGTVHPIWDAVPAVVDYEGALIDSALSDRADEIAGDFVNKLRYTHQRRLKHYSGIIPTLKPTSEISEIVWRDYGEREDNGGMITEVRSLLPDSALCPPKSPQKSRRSMWPDQHGRTLHPHYPHYMHVIYIGTSDDGIDEGGTVEPDDDDYYSCTVIRFDPEAGTYDDVMDGDTTVELCWVKLTNFEDLAPDQLTKGERYLGRLCGSRVDENADGRTLFLVRSDGGGSLLRGVMYADLSCVAETGFIDSSPIYPLGGGGGAQAFDAPFEASNKLAMAGEEGDVVIFTRQNVPSEPPWLIIQIQHKCVDVDVDQRVDAATFEIQHLKFGGSMPGQDGGWETWHTGIDCE